MQKPITLYTWPHCPYCINAKRLLGKLGLEYDDTNIFRDTARRKELTQETGQNTVPYIFIGDTFIGGYMELHTLHEEGRLMEIINE